MACIVSKEGHLELKTAGPLMSDPKEFVGSSALSDTAYLLWSFSATTLNPPIERATRSFMSTSICLKSQHRNQRKAPHMLEKLQSCL